MPLETEAVPGIEGFFPRNIWGMRAFYLAWTEEVEKLPQPVADPAGQNEENGLRGFPLIFESMMV
jgi:hypothetical protein